MIRALLAFLALYVALMIPWPGVRDAYRTVFIHAGKAVYGGFSDRSIRGADASPVFEAFDEEGAKVDTTINVLNRPSGGTAVIGLNSREIGFFPTAVAAALILATPAPWRRRCTSWLIGMAAVHGFIGLRLLVAIVFYANRVPHDVSWEPTVWQQAISAGVKFICVGQALSYVVPIVIWGLVAVRREHIELALGSAGANRSNTQG